MASITGNPIISPVSLYSSSTVPDSSYELGQLIGGKNGKAFRYALFGELGVVGDIMQSSAVDTQFDDMATTAQAAGLSTVTVTNGTTSVTAGQFQGGTLAVSVTPGLGEEYTIVDHGLATSGTTLTLVLDRPIATAWTTSTKLTMRRSPYSGVVKCPTSLTGTVAGVCVYPVASGAYGWLQVQGVCGVLSDNSTFAVGSDIGVPGAAAGSVGVNVAGTGKSNTVGRAMRAAASGKTIPVSLMIGQVSKTTQTHTLGSTEELNLAFYRLNPRGKNNKGELWQSYQKIRSQQ